MVHSITSLTSIVVLSASLAACHPQPGQTEMQKELQANEQAGSARSEAEQRAQKARAAAAPDVWDVEKDNLDKEWASLKADVDKVND
ncbi:MAG: hypothetical protein ABSF69_13160 [Polyangiaceae bacterium]|jgi:hypothetical protein